MENKSPEPEPEPEQVSTTMSMSMSMSMPKTKTKTKSKPKSKSKPSSSVSVSMTAEKVIKNKKKRKKKQTSDTAAEGEGKDEDGIEAAEPISKRAKSDSNSNSNSNSNSKVVGYSTDNDELEIDSDDSQVVDDVEVGGDDDAADDDEVVVTIINNPLLEAASVDDDGEDDSNNTSLEVSMDGIDGIVFRISSAGFALQPPRLPATAFIDIPTTEKSNRLPSLYIAATNSNPGLDKLHCNIDSLFGTSSIVSAESETGGQPQAQAAVIVKTEPMMMSMDDVMGMDSIDDYMVTSAASASAPAATLPPLVAAIGIGGLDLKIEGVCKTAEADKTTIVRRAIGMAEQRKILGSAASSSPLVMKQEETYGMPEVRSVEYDKETRRHIRKNRMPLPGAEFSCASCGESKHEAHVDTRCACSVSKKLCTDCVISLFVTALAPDENWFQLPEMVAEIDMDGKLAHHGVVHYSCTDCTSRFDMIYRQYPLPIPMSRSTANDRDKGGGKKDASDKRRRKKSSTDDSSDDDTAAAGAAFVRSSTPIPQSWLWRILHRKKVSANVSKFIPRKGSKMLTESFDCWYRRRMKSIESKLKWHQLSATGRQETRIYFCGYKACRHANLVQAPGRGQPFPAVVKCDSCHHLFCHCQTHLGPDTSISEFMAHCQHVPLRADLLGEMGEWTPVEAMNESQQQWMGDLLDARIHDYACSTCPECGIGRAQLTGGDSHVECPNCHCKFCFFCSGGFVDSLKEYTHRRSKQNQSCFAFSYGHVARIFNKPATYSPSAHNAPTQHKTQSQIESLNGFLTCSPSVNHACVRHLKDIPYYFNQEALIKSPELITEHYRRLRVLLRMMTLKEEWGSEKFSRAYFKSRQMQYIEWIKILVSDDERATYCPEVTEVQVVQAQPLLPPPPALEEVAVTTPMPPPAEEEEIEFDIPYQSSTTAQTKSLDKSLSSPSSSSLLMPPPPPIPKSVDVDDDDGKTVVSDTQKQFQQLGSIISASFA